jgi:zinc-ribbon domain
MDLGSIFLIFALFIPVILFIIRPIVERSQASVILSTNQDISNLLAERDHIIASIKELDDDYNLGKIPTNDYPTQRLALLHTGADILQRIDEFQAKPKERGAMDDLESAISTYRPNLETNHSPKKNGNAVPPVPDDALEQRIASRRRSRDGKPGGFCPKCGRPVQAQDRFCPHCGATLT